jgi:hypothetical protein
MDYPFTTDGCSGLFMRAVHWHWRTLGFFGLAERVRALCVEHDKSYWAGGTRSERVAADAKLVAGVAALGEPFLARLMFIGVSIGGHPLLPFPWRWGYGWRWPHKYNKV